MATRASGTAGQVKRIDPSSQYQYTTRVPVEQVNRVSGSVEEAGQSLGRVIERQQEQIDMLNDTIRELENCLEPVMLTGGECPETSDKQSEGRSPRCAFVEIVERHNLGIWLMRGRIEGIISRLQL